MRWKRPMSRPASDMTVGGTQIAMFAASQKKTSPFTQP